MQVSNSFKFCVNVDVPVTLDFHGEDKILSTKTVIGTCYVLDRNFYWSEFTKFIILDVLRGGGRIFLITERRLGLSHYFDLGNNLLNDNRRSISTYLCGKFDIPSIKPHRNNRIPPLTHTIPDHPLHSLIPTPIQHGREIFQFPADRRFKKRTDISAPIPCATGETVDCAEDTGDAVAGDVVHGGDDDAVGIGVGMEFWIIRACVGFLWRLL